MKKITTIYEWYKKVTNLINKNIVIFNFHGFSLDVNFMDLHDENKSISVNIFNHKKTDSRFVYKCDICTYYEESQNRKTFKELKNFLEKFETSCN